MKLPQSLAQNIAKYLEDSFNNSGYGNKDVNGFTTYAKNQLEEGFKTEWCLGGTANNCYGSSSVSAEPATELTQLDDFLMEHYLHTSFMQYKMICRHIEKSSRTNHDCYGGQVEYGYQHLSFNALAQGLIKAKLVDANEPLVEMLDVIQTHARDNFPVQMLPVLPSAKKRRNAK